MSVLNLVQMLSILAAFKDAFGIAFLPLASIAYTGAISSCYIAAELKEYLKDNHDMNQVHGRPMHQQTQGKIERYHRTMKNVVKLDNYYCPEELIRALEKFVRMYNNERYHESLQNLTPADVYYGRGDAILNKRRRIKQESFKNRMREYQKLKFKYQKNELVLN